VQYKDPRTMLKYYPLEAYPLPYIFFLEYAGELRINSLIVEEKYIYKKKAHTLAHTH
jgi:hypothetical protein